MRYKYKIQGGKVVYDDETKTVEISHPRRVEIEKYLTSVQEFRIPESPRIDNYRIDRVKPTENEMYMSLALCTLFAELGVKVFWD